MATQQALDHCISAAIQEIKRQVKRIRQSHPNVKHRIQDYPAMVVACGYKRSGAVFWGQSASPVNLQYEQPIKKRLEALAPIGEKRKGCDNVIGACAEPHAANQVVKTFPGCNMKELQFSSAFRPRTAQRKKYCKNCKETFYEVL